MKVCVGGVMSKEATTDGPTKAPTTCEWGYRPGPDPLSRGMPGLSKWKEWKEGCGSFNARAERRGMTMADKRGRLTLYE